MGMRQKTDSPSVSPEGEVDEAAEDMEPETSMTQTTLAGVRPGTRGQQQGLQVGALRRGDRQQGVVTLDIQSKIDFRRIYNE
jgi:hypothetical protein